MGDQEHVTIGEFSRTMGALERTIRAGFDGVNERLDAANGVQRKHGERIAVLEDARAATKRSAGIHGAAWGSIITAFLALIQYLVGLFHRSGT